MIKSLNASVTFDTGFTLSKSLQPLTGLTAVVGRNGTGKSFMAAELPRYLLYGKKALRGDASDYKNFDASGVMAIKGQDYTIKRGPKKEELLDATGAVIAVGAEAVTAKIIDLIGYDLVAFDMFNACMQKQADEFGKATPGERRKIVDRVVGLLSYKQAEDACRKQGTQLSNEAKAMSSVLVAPQKVAENKDDDSQTLAEKFRDARDFRYAWLQIESRANQPVNWPRPPEVAKVTRAEIEELEAEQSRSYAVIEQRKRLQQLIERETGISKFTSTELAQAQAFDDWQAKVHNLGPRPTLSAGQLSHEIDARQAQDDHDRLAALGLTCPHCGKDVAFDMNETNTPSLSAEELAKELLAAENWKDGEPPKPKAVLIPLLQAERAAFESQERRRAAQEELDRLEDVEDYAPRLRELRDAEHQWMIFQMQTDTAQQVEDSVHAARGELQALSQPLSEAELSALESRLVERRVYEKSVEQYEEHLATYTENQKLIVDKSAMAEEFRKGAEALLDARAVMKAYLAPALGQKASELLSLMTNGVLSKVEVEEDMNITVNGQKLKTLSGAGSTVANLALRIAFGQILVKDAFPVFIGDELDSDADSERRYLIAEAMSNLTGQFDQIIMITHGGIDVADHVISMENTT